MGIVWSIGFVVGHNSANYNTLFLYLGVAIVFEILLKLAIYVYKTF